MSKVEKTHFFTSHVDMDASGSMQGVKVHPCCSIKKKQMF